MAREETDAKQLELLAKNFVEIGDDLLKCVKEMGDAKIPYVLIHSRTIKNKHLSVLWDWLATVEKDVKSQVKAFRAGVASQAEHQVNLAASRKASAKKKGK